MGQKREDRAAGAEVAAAAATPFPWLTWLPLCCCLTSSTAMNVAVFPTFDPIFMPARDISVILSAGALLSIGLIAARCPARLHIGAWHRAVCVLFAVGALSLIGATVAARPVLLAVAASATALARAWSTVTAGLGLTALSRTDARRAIAAALLVAALSEPLFWLAPTWVGWACFLLLPPFGYAVAWWRSGASIRAHEHDVAPTETAITQPMTFIPLGSRFFLSLFAFRIAFGFSLRSGTSLLSALLTSIPVAAALFVVLLVGARRFNADVATKVSVLAVVGGFLCGAAPGARAATEVGIALLATGNVLFDAVAWAVLAAVGSRNNRASLAVVAWGRGVTSLGSVVGAGIGASVAQAASPLVPWAAASLLILALVAFVLFGLSGFSFRDTIAGVVEPVVEPAAAPLPDVGARCAELAEAYGLTKREAEVFELLARGRDRAAIEERLVVSRNTVKSHVKHIYEKLDVHSHQELLDVVEAEGNLGR